MRSVVLLACGLLVVGCNKNKTDGADLALDGGGSGTVDLTPVVMDFAGVDLTGVDLGGVVPDLSGDASVSADDLAPPDDLLPVCDGGECVEGVCVATFARVQLGKRTAGTGAMSDTVKLAADTQAGNLLVLAVGVLWNGAAKPLVVPSGWTLVEQRDNDTGTASHESVAFYVYPNAPVLAAATGVLVTNGDSDARMYQILVEYTGFRATLDGTTIVDQKISNKGNGNELSPGTTATTTSARQLWLSIGVSHGGIDHTSPTGGFAFADQMKTGAGAFSLSERVVTATEAATTSIGAGSGDWAAALVTLRR